MIFKKVKLFFRKIQIKRRLRKLKINDEIIKKILKEF